jgi:murein DD-endopeptidase MepM/ murein hydrolase activator NlpD
LGAIVASDSLEVEATADELADAHRTILTLTDSLRSISEPEAGEVTTAANGTDASHVAIRPVSRRSGLSSPAPGVVLPVVGQITSRFTRSRFHPLLRIFRPHKGVDVSAPVGTNITAPAAGRVAFVGRRLGDGLMVELDHGEGVVSRYAHCRQVMAREGDFVSVGDVIATVGSSGLSTGPHVHFEIRVRGTPVDPLAYVIRPRLTPTPAAAATSAPVIQAGSPAHPAPEHSPGGSDSLEIPPDRR